MVTIYHNPRCSKSRSTLSLLQDTGLEITVIRYLDTPPTAVEISELCTRLGLSVREIIRSSESAYKELSLENSEHSETSLCQIISDNPILMQRPIVVNGARAAIGRPPESVLEIL
ncbi:MAG: arsenate reductase (glutaredoxin) [Pseudomonadota bacterium]